jgi:pimeloyl-ACP methyl ester carboxylesterase
MDPAFTSGRAGLSEAELEAQERDTTRRLWEALARIPCPTLVVRGAASDVLAAETADRMVEEVLPRGRLAVVPRASHSVMIDNPEGFAEAVSAFVLGE